MLSHGLYLFVFALAKCGFLAVHWLLAMKFTWFVSVSLFLVLFQGRAFEAVTNVIEVSK